MIPPTGKRALIVDDSKSARAFLARLLEKHGLEVESVESAEAALEHLSHARPDVIFMDHLMPGMDGFQAVQSIKHNPRTATIPIMMYTSQEGELYLSQARALGAMGVLPKQVKHAELATALIQLGLMQDRRRPTAAVAALVATEGVAADAAALAAGHGGASAAATTGSMAAAEGAASATAPAAAGAADLAASAADGALAAGDGAASPAAGAHAPLDAERLILLRPMIESAVREQVGDLRRQLPALFADQSERLMEDVRAAIAGASLVQASAPPPPPSSPTLNRAPWYLAAAASLLAATFALLWWREAEGVAGGAADEARIARQSEERAAERAARDRANGGFGPSAQSADELAADAAAALAALAAVEERARGGAAGGSFGAGSLMTASAVVPAAATVAGTDSMIAPSAASGGSGERRASLVRPVPYGETPLGGERLETLRTLLSELATRGYRGVVTVTSYPGRFCLVGNAATGYALASDESPAARCDVVGNPFDEALAPAQREPVALANLIGAIRQQTGGALKVELAHVPAAEPAAVAPYPTQTDKITAGEWNRIAAANNRVEIRLNADAS